MTLELYIHKGITFNNNQQKILHNNNLSSPLKEIPRKILCIHINIYIIKNISYKLKCV